ncbi:MAG: hypothetical protein GY846_09350 [Deltaproteobacteria bacterium]|nr:hypothetical protein [Deltaproteobacteria bacterium]
MKTQNKKLAIHEAYSILEELSADEKTRHLAEMREKSLIDKTIELGAARREGERKGRRKEKQATSMNMIAMGSFSMEQVSQITGLSVDEVRRL